MVDLQQSRKKLDKINAQYKYSNRQAAGRRSRKKFDEMHHRVTTYLQNEVYEEIQALREQGKITNMTEFVNNALIEYLKE